MVGKKRILEQPCFSGAPSNKLYPPTSCATMLQESYFENGHAAKTKACTTQRLIHGIGCSNRASSYSTDSARTTAFAFANLAMNCRSNSPGQFLGKMTLLPTSTPLENWTRNAV